jgi:hypothetical protein
MSGALHGNIYCHIRPQVLKDCAIANEIYTVEVKMLLYRPITHLILVLRLISGVIAPLPLYAVI